MDKLYIADARWGRIIIISVEIEKETARQFKVCLDTKELIYGRSAPYVPSRIAKDSYTCSRSLDDMLASSANSLEKQRAAHQRNADEAALSLERFRKWQHGGG